MFLLRYFDVPFVPSCHNWNEMTSSSENRPTLSVSYQAATYAHPLPVLWLGRWTDNVLKVSSYSHAFQSANLQQQSQQKWKICPKALF